MELKLICKGCGKSLSYSEASEAKHSNEQIYNVERCSCYSSEAEEEIEDLKTEVAEMKDDFQKLMTKIVEMKSIELAEKALKLNRLNGKIPEISFMVNYNGEII